MVGRSVRAEMGLCGVQMVRLEAAPPRCNCYSAVLCRPLHCYPQQRYLESAAPLAASMPSSSAPPLRRFNKRQSKVQPSSLQTKESTRWIMFPSILNRSDLPMQELQPFPALKLSYPCYRTCSYISLPSSDGTKIYFRPPNRELGVPSPLLRCARVGGGNASEQKGAYFEEARVSENRGPGNPAGSFSLRCCTGW